MSNEIEIKIIKSELPIIWIDTSIINLMTQWKFKLCQFERIQEERILCLYNSIYDNVRKGRLICPLAEQAEEVWIERDKWFDTIHGLSLGIETEALFTIQINQICRFMIGYIKKEQCITLNYNDAFDDDPVKEVREIIKSPYFIAVNSPLLFGAEYHKRIKENIYQTLEIQRKKNIAENVTFEKQLELEYMGDIEALFLHQKKFLSNDFRDEDEKFNTILGVSNLSQQIKMWESLTGNQNDYKGLVNFYQSAYQKSMPFTKISCSLMAKLMTDKQPIRSGDVMDMKHASTLLPFSDIFITDKAMATFLKKRKFDQEYNTIVAYIGDSEIISSFFSNL